MGIVKNVRDGKGVALIDEGKLSITTMSMQASKSSRITQVFQAPLAIITLSTVSYPQVVAMASHEPNLLCLTAGSNITSAEWGANPRDDSDEKSEMNLRNISAKVLKEKYILKLILLAI